MRSKGKYYQPELLGVFVGLCFLFLWYLSSLAIENSVMPVEFELIVKVIIPAFSSFLGVYFAFFLRQKEDALQLENTIVSD